MGMICLDLVAPAILYNHPEGLTKEQYARKLFEASPGHVNRSYNEEFNLQRLSRSLRLPFTEQFRSFKQEPLDENNIPLFSPYLNDDEPNDVAVHINTKNELLPLTGEHIFTSEPLVEEQAYMSIWGDLLIEKVHDIFLAYDEYEYFVDAYPVKRHYRSYHFDSKESALQAFPEFHIDNKYQWDQQQGTFNLRDGTSPWKSSPVDKFYWQQRNGKYTLDSKTFDALHTSSSYTLDDSYCEKWHCSSLEAGYLDFILTTEFLKAGVLPRLPSGVHDSYYIDNLLKNRPSSRGIHNKAVEDSFYSHYAKDKNLSTADMLRTRALYRRF